MDVAQSMSPKASKSTLSQQEIAQQLHWQVDPDKDCNLCHGTFKEPAAIVAVPHPPPVGKVTTQFSFSGMGTYDPRGVSILQDRVLITQPGRIVKADKAIVTRDRHTGQLQSATLIGNVQLMEAGKLVRAPKGSMNFVQQTQCLEDALVHLAVPKKQDLTASEQYRQRNYLNAWAQAKSALRRADGTLELTDARYSTCNPLKPTWVVSAKSIKLDKVNNIGTVRNASLRVHNVPIAWVPYYTYPLNHERKSGFLTPILGYRTDNGADVTLPLYWNIAPNYDLLFTPRYMSERNIQANGLFRFLSPSSSGNIYASFIPDDNGFRAFQRNTLAENEPHPPLFKAPYLNQLKNDSDDRGYFSFHDQSIWSDEWKSSFDINYATDPYYFRDFGNLHNAINSNQLLNQFLTHYNGEHWKGAFFLQGYQTLQPITQISNTVTNQFSRLPLVEMTGLYPDIAYGIDADISAQEAYFTYQSEIYPVTLQQPLGDRLHLRPTLTRSFIWPQGYIKPQIAVDNTDFFAEQATIPFNIRTPYNLNPDRNRPTIDASRNLPILDLDTGLYLERYLHFHNADYVQTFEPRLFYLYVPYVNQDKYPIFDTEYLPFNYSLLYARNRFTGYDRLENANQMTLGFSSSLIRGEDAEPIMRAGAGMIYYFDIPRVGFRPGTITTNPSHWSPVTGKVSLYPWRHWTISANSSVDTDPAQLDNLSSTVQYSRDWRHILMAGYQYAVAKGRSQLGFTNATSLVQAGLSWGLTKQWSVVGYWYYNFSQQRPESYFGGLQYDNCCVAIRVIANRSFSGVDPNSTPGRVSNQYANTYFVQLQLKGLGSISRNDPSAILNVLPGFEDPFKKQPWG